VDPWSRCLCLSNDLIGCEVLIGAVQNLNDCLSRSGHALMLGAEQAQRSLDSRR
jgi:hypothetical protein